MENKEIDLEIYKMTPRSKIGASFGNTSEVYNVGRRIRADILQEWPRWAQVGWVLSSPTLDEIITLLSEQGYHIHGYADDSKADEHKSL